MSNDYWITLGHEDGLQTNSVTVRYHRLIANDQKKGDDGADELRSRWTEMHTQLNLDMPESAFCKWIVQPTFNLSILPLYSFHLQFTFKLAKPYLSKDDNPFYIIDNPIARDKVFQLPLVRPTSWKGSLCAALWQLGNKKEQDKCIQRLFGDIRDGDSGQAGRLRFYPTFFTQTGLEIINPHDREKRVGKNPILFESVPAGAKGTFSLLYVPFDRIGRDDDETHAQATEDLLLLTQGLQAMFCTYGFGAKTSSGFGVAEARVENASLVSNVPDKPQALPKPIAPQLPQEVQDFQEKFPNEDFPNEDFQLKPNAWRKQRQATNSQRYAYKQAREVYRRHEEEYATYEAELSKWESAADAPTPAPTPRSFETFNELLAETEKLAQSQPGGAE